VNQLINKTPIVRSAGKRLSRYLRLKKDIYRLKRLRSADRIRLVVGSSGVHHAGWVYTDIEYLDLLKPDDWERFFLRNSIDAILAEHVWEHLAAGQGLEAAKRCFEYLRPGGYLRAAVPDGFHPNEDYLDGVRPGGTGLGAEDHQVLYDHHSFEQLFVKAGFRVELLEYFDAAGEFHYREWSNADGIVSRSSRHDWRNQDGALNYTSIILDAHKDV